MVIAAAPPRPADTTPRRVAASLAPAAGHPVPAMARRITGAPRPTPVYGFDIETDTTVDGLDPRCARVVVAAVAGPDATVVFDDADEEVLLRRLDAHLAGLEPGVIATWNGSAFDLPFVADRAARHRLPLGLRLAPDDRLARRHPPLPGHAGAYRATWHGHAHLDGYRVFRGDVVPALGVSGSLKSMARLCGLVAIEIDRTAVHRYPAHEVRAYVASDAVCTRLLVTRRWATARLAVDPHPATTAPGDEPRTTGGPTGRSSASRS